MATQTDLFIEFANQNNCSGAANAKLVELMPPKPDSQFAPRKTWAIDYGFADLHGGICGGFTLEILDTEGMTRREVILHLEGLVGISTFDQMLEEAEMAYLAWERAEDQILSTLPDLGEETADDAQMRSETLGRLHDEYGYNFLKALEIRYAIIARRKRALSNK